METRIFTHKQLDNFTIVPNEIIQSTDLSFFAKGLLSYLLSLPSCWDISIGVIAAQFNEKESKITKAINELLNSGYCTRRPFRENGRLRGQKYYVSDTKGYFTEENIERAERMKQTPQKADPLNLQTPEKTDPLKNGGSVNKELNNLKNKNNNLESTEFIAPQQSAVQQTIFSEPDKATKTLFRNSKVAKLAEPDANGVLNFANFLAEFPNERNEGIDLIYYYNAVLNWSDIKDMKRTARGWLATIRQWISADREKGKLHKIGQQPKQNEIFDFDGAMEYLNA